MCGPISIAPSPPARCRGAFLAALLASSLPLGASGESPPPRLTPRVTGGVWLRVGLETDQREVSVACCQAGLRWSAGGRSGAAEAHLRVRPAGEAARAVFRVQVAALKDEDQAAALAERWREATGQSTDSSFDIASSLYRVRLGRFATREEAERLRERYAESGLRDGWVVEEGGGLRHAALAVAMGASSWQIEARWVALEPGAADGHVRLPGGAYRGRILVYLNDRGLLNVVNEVDLESYLRGVVPLEMGPDQYDAIEALKAQAVAARTFAVKSFGGFAAEGFDLCAAPRCQVYGGLEAEHPLADRAIAETAGEVVVAEGNLAEALFSASCGGSTENVENVFPRKHAPYLAGVECPEAGAKSLVGPLSHASSLASAVVTALLGEVGEGTSAVARATGRFAALARLAGLPVNDTEPPSLRSEEVRRWAAARFPAAVNGSRVPVSGERVASPSASLASSHSVGPGGPAGPVSAEELDEIVLETASRLGLVGQDRAYFLGLEAQSLTVRLGGRRRTFGLPDRFATFRRTDAGLEESPLSLAAGDRMRLLRTGDRLLAVVRDSRAVAGAVPRRDAWRSFRSRAGLSRTLASLYPDFELADLQVLDRGISGRVSRLRLRGRSGETVLLEGLSIRWTLDLPDTLFELSRGRGEGGEGWWFEGRGHGHGVGMCQLGAVVMARRGQTYREILAHYYSGARLGRLRS